MTEIIAQIKEIVGTGLKLNEPMSRHTSLRIGGPAEIFVKVDSLWEMARIIEIVNDNGLRMFILGAGSNLLVRDEGLKGVIIKLEGDLKRIRIEGERLFAGAGAGLKEAVRMAAENGLSGLEFASGIPGTIGGAVQMNASFGQSSISDILLKVMRISYEGEVVVKNKEDLIFGYRESSLEGLFLEVELLLKKEKTSKIREKILEFKRARERSQPKGLSAGCTFKNPPGTSAGRLIEEAGLKGTRVGQAQISSKHANFILNLGEASSLDVLTLIEQAKEKVRDRFGILLEEEIVVV